MDFKRKRVISNQRNKKQRERKRMKLPKIQVQNIQQNENQQKQNKTQQKGQQILTDKSYQIFYNKQQNNYGNKLLEFFRIQKPPKQHQYQSKYYNINPYSQEISKQLQTIPQQQKTNLNLQQNYYSSGLKHSKTIIVPPVTCFNTFILYHWMKLHNILFDTKYSIQHVIEKLDYLCHVLCDELNYDLNYSYWTLNNDGKLKVILKIQSLLRKKEYPFVTDYEINNGDMFVFLMNRSESPTLNCVGTTTLLYIILMRLELYVGNIACATEIGHARLTFLPTMTPLQTTLDKEFNESYYCNNINFCLLNWHPYQIILYGLDIWKDQQNLIFFNLKKLNQVKNYLEKYVYTLPQCDQKSNSILKELKGILFRYELTISRGDIEINQNNCTNILEDFISCVYIYTKYLFTLHYIFDQYLAFIENNYLFLKNTKCKNIFQQLFQSEVNGGKNITKVISQSFQKHLDYLQNIKENNSSSIKLVAIDKEFKQHIAITISLKPFWDFYLYCYKYLFHIDKKESAILIIPIIVNIVTFILYNDIISIKKSDYEHIQPTLTDFLKILYTNRVNISEKIAISNDKMKLLLQFNSNLLQTNQNFTNWNIIFKYLNNIIQYCLNHKLLQKKSILFI